MSLLAWDLGDQSYKKGIPNGIILPLWYRLNVSEKLKIRNI
jgi:hypothetical protein